ncbi:MAG: FTR1 family iron permease [Solirubrobacterales bacterium]
MLAAGIIVFREVLEAALVAGIILAATKGVARSRLWVVAGVVAGLFGAGLIAASADVLSEALAGMGQEAFNASVLLVAVGMLAWHNAWMSKHGREMAAEMKAVGHAVSMGSRPLSVLALVVGIAVLREGAETVLFLYGISAGGDGTVSTALGALGGLAAGIAMGTGLYVGLVAIPTRHLFTVTTWLVTLLAAGMAAKAVAFLASAGLINGGDEALWDSSQLLSERSLPGQVLNTLVGYVDRPMPEQLAAWAATILMITVLTRMVRAR